MDDLALEKLLEKVRTAKTGEERDQLLRELAARDKAAPAASEMAEVAGAGKQVAEGTKGQAQGYVPTWKRNGVLFIMVFCGILTIADAVPTILKGRYGSFEINTVIMGCVFLFAAVFVILNERLLARRDSAGGWRKRVSIDGGAASGKAEGEKQRMAPEMRVVIIVLLAVAGLGSMVWSTLRFMNGRWDHGDLWLLMQGCVFLFYAIHLFLKKETDRQKAGG
jgi:hypothetical protein